MALEDRLRKLEEEKNAAEQKAAQVTEAEARLRLEERHRTDRRTAMRSTLHAIMTTFAAKLADTHVDVAPTSMTSIKWGGNRHNNMISFWFRKHGPTPKADCLVTFAHQYGVSDLVRAFWWVSGPSFDPSGRHLSTVTPQFVCDLRLGATDQQIEDAFDKAFDVAEKAESAAQRGVVRDR